MPQLTSALCALVHIHFFLSHCGRIPKGTVILRLNICAFAKVCHVCIHFLCVLGKNKNRSRKRGLLLLFIIISSPLQEKETRLFILGKSFTKVLYIVISYVKGLYMHTEKVSFTFISFYKWKIRQLIT